MLYKIVMGMNEFLSKFKTWIKLSAGFGLLIVFVIILGMFSMFSSSQLGGLLHGMYEGRVVEITKVDQARLLAVYHSRTVWSLAAEQDNDVIDDIITELKDYESRMYEILNGYLASGDLTEKEKSLLKTINEAWPQYISRIDAIEGLARRTQTGGAMALANGQLQSLFRLVDESLAEIVKINQQKAYEADQHGAAIATTIWQISLALVAAATLLGIIISFLVTRNITIPLGHAVDELDKIASGDMTARIEIRGDDEAGAILRGLVDVQTSLSGMVAHLQSTARHLEQSVHAPTDSSFMLSMRSRQSSQAICEAATAIEGLTISIDSVGLNAEQASNKAAQAGHLAAQGRILGEEAANGVTSAVEKVAQTAEMIQELSSQIREIGTVANIIKDIASQTNLLALNAAIEAARAGETGRGFAVVADEVRKLSERTTSSAQEITGLIDAIQAGTDAVVDSMNESRFTLGNVHLKFAETAEAVITIETAASSAVSAAEEISSALREQRATSKGIVKNVENVTTLSEENAQAAATVSEAMSNLREIAEELGKITQKFKVLG